MSYWALSAITFVLALLGTGVARRHAIKRQIMDVPNSRSSHVAATPRGGGVAIVVATLLAFAWLTWAGAVDKRLFGALLICGSAIAVIGYFDDRRPVPARVRLPVHFVAALAAMVCLGGLPELQFGAATVKLGWIGYALGVVGIVWVLNLFNFMDGIDGIAGSEAVFIGLGGAALAMFTNPDGSAVVGPSLALAAACGGFLVWNWPPAKIFMGDVGSGFIGCVIAILAIAAARENTIALLLWLILGGVFFVDATLTLVRRVARGESAHEPHRTHAYQWLARRWNNHKPVTLAVTAVNVLWLMPCAVVAALYPSWAGWLAMLALTPLVVAALAAGAGRPEVR